MVAFKSGQDFPPAGSEERIIMGKNHRPDRMAGEIRKIIGELLVNGVKDPRITENFVNVTDVLSYDAGALYLRQDVGDVGLVHRGECETLLAEVVERCADVDER